MSGFVHLHIHNHLGSRLDGVGSPEDYARKAFQLNHKALAVTDHGRLSAIYEHQVACIKHGIKPILGCLLKGQEIITINGIKNVEDIKVGDFVLTHKGRFKKVIKTFNGEFNGKIYEIVLSDSMRSLKLTEEHPILIKNKDGNKWFKPGEIKTGHKSNIKGINGWNSYVCFPKIKSNKFNKLNVINYINDLYSINEGKFQKKQKNNKYESLKLKNQIPLEIKIDKDLAYFIGLFIAEGHISHKKENVSGSMGFTFNISEKKYASFCQSFLSNRFNIKAKILKRKNHSTLDIYFCNIILANLFEKIIGKNCYTKRIPSFFMDTNNDIKLSLLQGIFDGDGSKIGNQKTLTTTSKNLVWQVKTLLANFNQFSVVGLKKSNDFYSYVVSWTKNSKYKRILYDNDFIYKPIKEITYYKSKTSVYNFEVEEDNSYVSEFVLHNCEMYIQDELEAFDEKGKRRRLRNSHIIILVKNEQGYKNLLRLNYISNKDTRHFYYSPRITTRELFEYGDGLVIGTACMANPFVKLLRNGKHKEAEQLFEIYVQRFGEDMFAEVQLNEITGSIDGLPNGQKSVNSWIIQNANKFGIPIVVTGDVHYTEKGQDQLQTLSIAIRDKSTIDNLSFELEAKNLYFHDEEDYINFNEEWNYGYKKSNIISWCNNAVIVADKCNYIIPERTKMHLPKIHEDSDAFLIDKAREGLMKHFDTDNYSDIPVEYRKRLARELEILIRKGFSSYLNILQNVYNFVKMKRYYRGPSRGSAAGSLVLYSLCITTLDPIKYELLFERFVSETRTPDIVLDYWISDNKS